MKMILKQSRKLLLSNAEFVEIRDCCLRLLARREHSRRELLNKLEANGFKQDVTQKIIDDLAEEGLQSDARFTENFIRQRIRTGHGPVRIAYELRQRGIDDFDPDELVVEMAGSWPDVIEQVYHKKYKNSKSITRNEWSKRTRFLQQRGFTFEMIRSLYRRLDGSLD